MSVFLKLIDEFSLVANPSLDYCFMKTRGSVTFNEVPDPVIGEQYLFYHECKGWFVENYYGGHETCDIFELSGFGTADVVDLD